MKKYEIIPLKNKLDAVIELPGSKSYTNRALIIASLCNGKTVLKNALISNDIIYLIKAIRQLGIKIELNKTAIIVYGKGGIFQEPKESLYLEFSGTGIRLLTGLVSLVKGKSILTGEQRLQERPIQPLIDGLKQLGVNCETKNNNGCPPVIVNGGTLIGGKCQIQGNISSQFISSIMLIAPYTKKDVIIDVIGELTSIPYIDITIDIMKSFGVNVINNNYKTFIIKSGQRYINQEYIIEGDASSASYFFGLAAINKGKVTVKNINQISVQGDLQLINILKKMGCKITKKINEIEIEGTDGLIGIDVDMNKMPDVVPTLAIISTFAKNKTKISNIASLRIKESDRILSVQTELKKLGIETESTKDSLIIHPNKLTGNIDVQTYDDHRIAMSFAIIGSNIKGIIINDPDCVKKSFPEFWDNLKNCGIGVKNV
jgi:3-phosphoshikimate 1-carboxyvinyltransferase